MKTKVGISPLLSSPNDKNSIKFDDKDKADILQKQFCSVFTKKPDDDLPYFPSRTETNVEITISLEDIKKEISSLNCNKSIGPDEIHPSLLQELSDFMAIPIFITMNKSLEAGMVPKDWNLAHVSPIYKKGPRNLAENYRPISLTSIVCRMMEKLIKNQIMEHLINDNLLSSKQHGFINKRSTVTQLLNYLDKCETNDQQLPSYSTILTNVLKPFLWERLWM